MTVAPKIDKKKKKTMLQQEQQQSHWQISSSSNTKSDQFFIRPHSLPALLTSSTETSLRCRYLGCNWFDMDTIEDINICKGEKK